MFLFCSEHPGPKTLNAILPMAPAIEAPKLAERDLEILQRLIELGMQIAERAASEILEETQAPSPEQAVNSPRPRRANPRAVFNSLFRLIRDTVILKTRLAAGQLSAEAPRPRRLPVPPQPALQATKPAEDPRRPHLIRYLRETNCLSRQKRKIPLTGQDIETRVDAELAKDPENRLQGRLVLLRICKSLDLPFHADRLPLDLLRPPAAAIAPTTGPPPN